MDFKVFQNDILNQNLNVNLNKIVWRKFFKMLKIFSKIRNISPKAIKKKMVLVHVIPFAPSYWAFTLRMFFKKLPIYMWPMCTHV
jgi:hypothetical protein